MTLPQFEEVEARLRKMGYPTKKPAVKKNATIEAFDKLQAIVNK